MAAPLVKISVRDPEVSPGGDVVVTYEASDPDQGRQVTSQGVVSRGDYEGLAYTQVRTLHDEIKVRAPVADGLTFVEVFGSNGMVWKAAAPKTAGVLTITGAVEDLQGNVSTAQASVTVRSALWTPRFPGDVLRRGTVYYGATKTGNGDPTTWERQVLGRPLAVSRTYWDIPSEQTGCLARLKADKAAGRSSDIAVKFGSPSQWRVIGDVAQKAMKAGSVYNPISRFALAVKDLRFPVKITVHHEPEGGGTGGVPDGDAEDYRYMQTWVQRLIRRDSDNIALGICLMAYSMQYLGKDHVKNPDRWWVSGTDFFMIDGYNYWNTVVDGVRRGWRFWPEIFDKPLAFARERGVRLSVGEYGVRPTDHDNPHKDNRQSSRQYLIDGFEWAKANAAHVFEMVYFNSTGGEGWVLDGERERTFAELLARPEVARIAA